MKIISSFKDYYDGSASLWYDDSIVYVRKPEELNNTTIKKFANLGKKSIGAAQLRIFNRLANDWSIEVDTVVAHKIFVCGNEYSYIEILNHKTPHIYSVKTLCKFFEIDNSNQLFDTSKYKNRYVLPSRYIKSLIEFVDNSEVTNDETIRTELINIGCPVVSVSNIATGIGVHSDNLIGFSNPMLMHTALPSLADPYTMSNMISHFVSNDLAVENNPPVEISDSDKITGHGFDKDYGFRNRPK